MQVGPLFEASVAAVVKLLRACRARSCLLRELRQHAGSSALLIPRRQADRESGEVLRGVVPGGCEGTKPVRNNWSVEFKTYIPV